MGVGVVEEEEEEEVGETGRQQQQLRSAMAQVNSSHWLRACDMALILSCRRKNMSWKSKSRRLRAEERERWERGRWERGRWVLLHRAAEGWCKAETVPKYTTTNPN